MQSRLPRLWELSHSCTSINTIATHLIKGATIPCARLASHPESVNSTRTSVVEAKVQSSGFALPYEILPMKKPRMLREGDRVALLALSSPAKSPREVDKAVHALEGYGLSVIRGKSLTLARDYIAGTAAERIQDVTRAMAHDDLAGIFFLRGGYGSAQLLAGIDFEEIARRRILVGGFSDLTSILNACVSANLCALHVPTMASHFVAHPPTSDVDRTFRALAFGSKPVGSIREQSGGPRLQTLRPGSAKGRLIGGNLTVFTTLIGTPWMPAPRGKILFLEEVGETPYRIDRMLTHLRNCGYLGQLAGIVPRTVHGLWAPET
jgi:muramoyltetrapeptide carboxypeptidase